MLLLKTIILVGHVVLIAYTCPGASRPHWTTRSSASPVQSLASSLPDLSLLPLSPLCNCSVIWATTCSACNFFSCWHWPPLPLFLKRCFILFFCCSLFSETQAVSVTICDGACWTLLGEKWIWHVPKVYNLVSMFKKMSGTAHSAWSQFWMGSIRV